MAPPAARSAQSYPPIRSVPPSPTLSAWGYRLRVWEYLLRSWRPYFFASLSESIGAPVLYLLAMGLGLGSLVDRHGSAALGGVSYLDYIAPALLASAALQIAIGEASYSTFSRFKWSRVWWGIVSVPVTPAQIADAQNLFIATRLTVASTMYYLVLLIFGAAGGPAGLLMVPVAVLCAMACASLVVALSAKMDDEGGKFNLLFRFGVIPMTLFSASFFPIDRLPWAVRWLAIVSPLWHGNELARDAALGTGSPAAVLGHLAYLLVLLVLGLWLSRRYFRRRLIV
jgi:lipooligosaccharide transport system permease protein